MNAKNISPKNTEDKPRFNIADVIILIVIVAIIAALGLRIYNIFDTEEEVCKVEVTFKVTGVSEENISLAKDAKLYYTENNEEVGYIKNFTISDTLEYAYNENGELVEAKVPGKKTVTGTLVLVCEKTEKGFYVGGTQLLTIGETVGLYTTTREMAFEILSAREISPESSSSSTTSAHNSVTE